MRFKFRTNMPKEASSESDSSDSEVFSENQTFNTNPSSYASQQQVQKSGPHIGKPLRVVDLATVDEEKETAEEVNTLVANLNEIVDKINQSVLDTSKATVMVSGCLNDFKCKIPLCMDDSGLRSVVKIVLHFLDNLLRGDAFVNARAILMRRFVEFFEKAGMPLQVDELMPMPVLYNFSLDVMPEKLAKILQEMTKTGKNVVDQEGAFIAPVFRGLTRDTSLVTLMFGFPHPTSDHYELVQAMYSLFPDIHFVCIKDSIVPCASVSPGSYSTRPRPKFVPPYRMPAEATRPAIGMSLSSVTSKTVTGTLGGFLTPEIKPGDNSLLQFADSYFAMTCAHVVLSDNQNYPFVNVPSKVLVDMYKQALGREQAKYKIGSMEEQVYREEIESVGSHSANFGQVVWGERTIVNGKLSDFAIIKVNPDIICENYLGDDISLPDLHFHNLYVKEVVEPKARMQVFKYGATTKHTSGELNGCKMIYWADGKMQSSEFVVASPQPLFASGGDSGSWVLTKLDTGFGLGCVGMIHSYDGEMKQFGLYTPMTDILDRLQKVTNVKWNITCSI